MLKAASCACVVAVGIFLIVVADTGTEVSGIDFYDEPSDTNFTEEALGSTERTSEHEAEQENIKVHITSYNEPSDTNSTEESVRFTRNEQEEDDKDPESITRSEEDGIKSPRVPKRRKFEENEEMDKESQESSEEVFRSDTISTDSTDISLKALSGADDGSLGQSNTVCGAPPEIEGAVTPVLEGTEHKVNTTISYQCNFGYVSRGSVSFISTCKIDRETGRAKWTKPDVQCVSRSCGDPGYVPNARRIGNLFTFPNKVEFQCEEGYKLRGLRDRYCQVSGEWSGRLPTCEKIYCSVPSDPVNGRVLYSSLEYGAELRYECNKGFVTANRSPRVCTYDGTWSDSEPECIEVRCKTPESPEHGSVRLLGEPKVGSIALYFCDEGTTISGTASSKCTRDGDWTFDPPKCMRSCKVIDVRNGEIGQYKTVRYGYGTKTRQQFSKFQVGKSVNHSETVTLQCKTGFMPPNSVTGYDDGSVRVMCSGGLWDAPMLCEPKPCLGNPPSTENGTPVVTNNTNGAVIWYRCNDDFVKIKGKVWCDHGTWKGNAPICSDTRCYLDQLNFPGLRKPTSRLLKSGSSFNIACMHGYKTTRPGKIKCKVGKWNTTENPCEIETCDEDPPSVMNGRPMQIDREHGSLVHYECDQGFDLVSSQTVRCNAGKWEGEPPFCQEFASSVTTTSESSRRHEFGVPPKALSALPDDECFCSYDFETYITATVGERILQPEEKIKKGETVTFRCTYHYSMILKWRNGLNILGTANLTCSECKKWSQTELPTCETLKPGESVLLYNNKMRILAGGIIEINNKDNFEVSCQNSWIQPKWYPSDAEGIHITEEYSETYRVYTTKMYTREASYRHGVKYECFSMSQFTAYNPTVLELRVAEQEIRCPELSEYTNKGVFSITYENDRKVNSAAYYTCRDPSQKLIGGNSRMCLENGQWSIPVYASEYPSCEDITCTKFPIYNGLIVLYTNSQKVNSIAKFRCSNQSTLMGSNSSECQPDGTWTHPRPRCEMLDIRCPALEKKGIFTIEYSKGRSINSTARFYCKGQYKKIEGCSVRTCQPNLEWSGTYPTCIDLVNCVPFEDLPGLEVSYSDNFRVGSVATFRCQPSYKLLGRSSARCRFNGTWNHPAPICEPPQCFIDDPTNADNLISTLPEGVVADLSKLAEEHFDSAPYGTEIPLLCEDDLIHTGSKKATCGLRGKWELGNVQCLLGCRFSSDTQSRLLVNPIKEFYRFGDTIILSCLPGQKLSSDVERVMCLGKSFSHDLPECMEITETSPSALRETKKSA